MAFGHWMEVVDGDVRLRLGPVRREDAGRYVSAEAGFGLQSYVVTRYLGLTFAPTPQGEEEWWDRAAKADDPNLHWGIYVPDGDDWALVGSTTLHLRNDPSRRAESGFLLFDRSLWGRRIASVAHLGRTHVAFHELDLLAVTSNAAEANVGSVRALERVGYVRTGTRYSADFVDGRVVDGILFLLPNPNEEAWRYFWRRPDDEIPAAFHEARVRTRAALERAATAVTFL
jgi:RimJ/RimL family protein N-acetyltransferase